MNKEVSGPPILFSLALYAAFACFFGSIALLILKLIWWLRFGYSPTLTIKQVLPAPSVSWIGVQRMIDWVWALPMWVGLLGLTMLLVYVATAGEDRR